MPVVTRFAPSPTGFLHIGGARTALFNWLYAKHHGGTFHLRIEDTDRQRSTQEAIDAIIDGMHWLGLEWDGEVVHQFSRAARHAEVARELVARGQAYYCYMQADELAQLREEAKKEGKVFRYDNRWRERSAAEAPAGVKPSIRIKAPLEGSMTIRDKVQGEVTVDCKQLDDMVLLRSDGTPTYMLAVVVDDHDMGVTQIIRGDDHLTNSFRQLMIYQAMGWEAPAFAHIPLIHGADGAKLSKRHGALGVEAYRDMGYLPEAIRNYLLRLGWSHGDEEIISTEQAIEWFDLDAVGKSPSRFDFTKLENLNGHYIREADNTWLVEQTIEFIKKAHPDVKILERSKNTLLKGMPGLKQRAKTLKELADNAVFYVVDDITNILYHNTKAKAVLEQGGKSIIAALLSQLDGQNDWRADSLQTLSTDFAEKNGKKLGDIAQPLRAALTGSTVSPGIFEVMEVLGKEESLGRLRKLC